MDEFEIELKKDFLQEANQILDDVENAFLELEVEPDNKENLNKIFRFAHNLKGTSRAVGFGEVAEFTHELENLILKIVDGTVKATPAVVSLMLECKDCLALMIHGLQKDLDAKFETSFLLDKISKALTGIFEDQEASPLECSDHSSDPSDVIDLTEEACEVVENVPSLESFDEPEHSELSPLVSLAPEHVVQKEETSLSVESPLKNNLRPTHEQKEKKTAISEEESIRVGLSKVEKLIDFVGEMVILQTVLEQMQLVFDGNRLMKNSISQLGKISREIQEISMGLRMIPLKNTFQKMNRIVRDTSRILGKQVELSIQGEETEIDKTVLEHLSDPLVHIIRNAIDHGLESPEDRVSAGKSSKGLVELWAYHSGNQLVIEVSDDGRGIDPQKIFQKAVEKKIISANQQMSEKQILDLIFHPGFSTKDQISEVSGRGVGMDVVKTNIEKLSGSIHLVSVKGMGSNFKIILPLTMAIVDAMVIEVRSHRYIIPLAQIKEALQIQSSMIEHITGYGSTLNSRGESYPLIDLAQHLSISHTAEGSKFPIAIIVNNPDVKFAVKIDNILRQQQVVVKKLSSEVKTNKGVVASSILGDGKPALILDLMEFVPMVKDISMKKSNNHLAKSA